MEALAEAPLNHLAPSLDSSSSLSFIQGSLFTRLPEQTLQGQAYPHLGSIWPLYFLTQLRPAVAKESKFKV